MLDQLLALDNEAIALKTNDIWRNQEIDNIRTVIGLNRQFLERGRGINEESIVEAGTRLAILRVRPEYAGNHEKFKNL